MMFDGHFGFIFFSYLALVIGVGGIVIWTLVEKRRLKREMAELEEA